MFEYYLWLTLIVLLFSREGIVGKLLFSASGLVGGTLFFPRILLKFQRMKWLNFYWLVTIIIGVPVIHFCSRRVKSAEGTVLLRKGFHFLALVLFLPPILILGEESFEWIGIAGSTVIALMLVLEMFRIAHRRGAKGNSNAGWSSRVRTLLSELMSPLLDKKDKESRFVTSHIELLFACVGPVILATSCKNPALDAIPVAGILTVGVGDSFAAISGLFARNPHRIPETSKSLEGFLGFIISVSLFLYALQLFRFSTAIATLCSGLTELFVRKFDNTLVPLVFIGAHTGIEWIAG